jgi:hypothetical protein
MLLSHVFLVGHGTCAVAYARRLWQLLKSHDVTGLSQTKVRPVLSNDAYCGGASNTVYPVPALVIDVSNRSNVSLRECRFVRQA